MSKLIKFKGELFKPVQVERSENSCSLCYWEGNMQVKCPSELGVWECTDNENEGYILEKITLTELFKDL